MRQLTTHSTSARIIHAKRAILALSLMALAECAFSQPTPQCAPGYTYVGGRWLPQYSPGSVSGHWIGGKCEKLPPPNSTTIAHWTQGTNSVPAIQSYIGLYVTKILLSDGTVMAQACTNSVACGQQWLRLTPDAHGSYKSGTWTSIHDSNFSRSDYGSTMLKDGRVFFIGGEFTDSMQQGEIYDPATNTWTKVSKPPTDLFASNAEFLDSQTMLLPDGRVLVAPVKNAQANNTIIYDPMQNVWAAGAQFPGGRTEDEATWVKLADDSIIAPNPDNIHSERYIPSQNKWVDDATMPSEAVLYGKGEIGPGFLLQSGKAFFFGGSGHTAIYSPPTGTETVGAWTAGPAIPGPNPNDVGNGSGVAADVAGAMLPNGKIIINVGFSAGNGGSIPPGLFYEFDPTTSKFRQITAPNGAAQIEFTPGNIGYLVLPDGTIMGNSGDASKFAYFYGPNEPPLSSGKPTITDISENSDGSYHLSGTGFNGLSQGASFGDDAQMDSNYPIVELMLPNGTVRFAKTFNWSSTGVQTGMKPVTTEFRLTKLDTIICNKYALVVIANGISSNAISFAPSNCKRPP